MAAGVFPPSGNNVVAGNHRHGYQVYGSEDGRQIGPRLGAGASGAVGGLLAFSGDERTLLSDGPNGAARFWRLTEDTAPVGVAGDVHSIWTPSGDAAVAITPDASGIVIGDRGGHVHVLPADVSAEQLEAAVEDVSFLGHNAPVSVLRVSSDGRLAASAAEDNTVRVWNLADGQPLPYMTDMPGGTVAALEFSLDTSVLAVLSGTGIVLLDSQTGEEIVSFQAGDIQTRAAFAGNERVYIGGQAGALRVIARDSSGAWSMQQLWQGEAPIRSMRASPNSRHLVLVDENNRAQQFSLTEGRTGNLPIDLPDTVESVAFDPAGSRVYFRTARWVHRASISKNGLIWVDAVFGPSAVHGAEIVYSDSVPGGEGLVLPVVGAGSIGVASVRFEAPDGTGLFGNKDELLATWRDRLGLNVPAPPERPVTAETVLPE